MCVCVRVHGGSVDRDREDTERGREISRAGARCFFFIKKKATSGSGDRKPPNEDIACSYR